MLVQPQKRTGHNSRRFDLAAFLVDAWGIAVLLTVARTIDHEAAVCCRSALHRIRALRTTPATCSCRAVLTTLQMSNHPSAFRLFASTHKCRGGDVGRSQRME